MNDFLWTEQATAGVTVEERADGKPVVVGHAAVWYDPAVEGTEYNMGFGVRERVARGAFDGVLERGDDVAALRDHDPSLLLGRTPKTLRLAGDSVGLRYEIDIDNTTVGTDTAKMAKRGDLRGSSFGFQVVKEEFHEDGGDIFRTLKEVRLFDVGPVTFPAYSATDAKTAKRSLLAAGLERFILLHRDDNGTAKLESRARKLFGLEIPTKATYVGRSVQLADADLRLRKMGR